MSKYIAVIPRAAITRAALVEAGGRSMEQVKAACGCSHIINAWFYVRRALTSRFCECTILVSSMTTASSSNPGSKLPTFPKNSPDRKSVV